MRYEKKDLTELTNIIWENSKTTINPLSFYEARQAAEAILPVYKAATEQLETYRDRLDQIDEIALQSGLNGTDSRITQIHYLASR